MEKKRICVGLLAHVDAGKTTLSEAMLYRTGSILHRGRVDHGDTALDTHALERKRGITIFSAQAQFFHGNTEFFLVDTPGHVDFSGEMERTLRVLDIAVLVISGSDGVQAHTETLWRLLRQMEKPVFFFVTKMDLPAADKSALLMDLSERLSERVMDFTEEPDEETLALCDEELLEQYLEKGGITDRDVGELAARRKLFPCWFGSGLRAEGIDAFLDGLDRYTLPSVYPTDFGARVYKISRDAQGNRCTHVKITGGTLGLRETLRYSVEGEKIEEKVIGISKREGVQPLTAVSLEAGEVGILLGLSRTYSGQGLGFESDTPPPALVPAMRYRLTLPPEVDPLQALPLLRRLEEEDPLLQFDWNAQLKEIQLRIMGQVQIEVLTSLIEERFGWQVSITGGRVMYRETIAGAVEGVGHYEPLRHYAEAHLLLEPLERGQGLEFRAECPPDSLDVNWQRLILTHLAEKTHLGVLTGSPIADIRITLIAGKAHVKHTDGGDFRQATYRAVRQGLMKAKSILLEPYCIFRLEVPTPQTGRAISDVRAMSGAVTSTESGAEFTVLRGMAPMATVGDYAAQVAAYTGGRGSFSLQPGGYMPCHNTAEVVADIGYDPESDTENSPDSIFCAHGGGFLVKWDRADEYMHIDTGFGRNTATPRAPRPRMGTISIDEKELEAIMVREFGPIRRPMYTKPDTGRAPAAEPPLRNKQETLVIDGYNVIFAWTELNALAEDNIGLARQRLAEILVSYRGFTGSHVILVFDGYAVPGGVGEKSDYHGVKLVFTRAGETADAYIERLLHDIGKNDSVRVVTSDNLIRLSAIGSGVLRTGAREFGLEVDWVMDQIGDILRRGMQGGHLTKLSESKL